MLNPGLVIANKITELCYSYDFLKYTAGGQKEVPIKLNKVRAENKLLYRKILAITIAMIRKLSLAKISPEAKENV